MNTYFEKSKTAKKNLQWFFGTGIIGAIIPTIISGAAQTPLAAFFIFLLLIYIFGSIAIGIRFFFTKTGLIPLTFYTFGIFVIIGIVAGVFISPFIIIRSICTIYKNHTTL